MSLSDRIIVTACCLMAILLTASGIYLGDTVVTVAASFLAGALAVLSFLHWFLWFCLRDDAP